MSEVTDIRQALADAISAGLGEGYQVSPWRLSNPTYPSVQIWPGDIAYHKSMSDGLAFWNFNVRVLVGLTSDIGAQQTLDSLMGENGTGVKAAVEADRTLGGACDKATVRGAGNYETYATTSGTQLIGADWTVEVLL